MKKISRTRVNKDQVDSRQAHDDLALYSDPKTWDELGANDRERLALLFIGHGEQQDLDEHHDGVVDAFETAVSLAPHSARVFLLVGQAYAKRGRNSSALGLAHEKFATAIKLDPSNPEAWQADGAVLVKLGETYHELGYLKEAERCLSEAMALYHQQNSEQPISLLQDYGDCWNAMGRCSGEAYDFRKSIEFYRSALARDGQNANLWGRYGHVVELLSRLVSKQELLREAIDSYCQALALAPDALETHAHLASLYLRIYSETGDLGAMHNAEQGFKKVITLDKRNVEGWLGWAVLLSRKGERQRDADALKDAVAKFQAANECEPDLPLILNGWGEALTILGSLTENLHLLREGCAKILRALQIEPDNSTIWRTYASCLTEIGCYFNDESHYLEALDKVKIGLKHDEFSPSLWAVLARIYASLGNLRGDMALVEESCKYFEKAAELFQADVPALYNEWGVSLMRLTEATHERRFIEEAVTKFEKAIVCCTEDPGMEKDPEWLYNYGCALDFLGDFTDNPEHYEKAIKVLTFVVNTAPDFRHARYNLAMAWAHLAELTAEVEFFQTAVAQLEELVKEDGEDEISWNELGITLMNLAQLVRDPAHLDLSHDYLLQAERHLQQAVALGNTQAYYSIACLYSLLGKYDLAMHFLERADSSEALPGFEELLHDEWLEGVRQTSAFTLFTNQLANKLKRR